MAQEKGLYVGGSGSSSKKKDYVAPGMPSSVTQIIQSGQLAQAQAAAKEKLAAENSASATSKSTSSSASPSTSTSYSYTPSYSFSYSPYSESQEVINARNAMNAHNANPIADWTGGTYGEALNEAMQRILNKEDFKFDLNDSLYQQYKNQFLLNGLMSMQDTMGQASAMTGGYGSSYATTAGNQAYQGSLQQLNNMIPELYQLAYDKYSNGVQDLYNQYGMISDAYGTEYGEWQDKVNNWNTEADRLTNLYYNLANMDFSRYSSDRSAAESAYAKQIAALQKQVEEKKKNEKEDNGNSGSSPDLTTQSGRIEWLAEEIPTSSGLATLSDKKKYLIEQVGIPASTVNAESKYVFKNNQVKDRL